MKEIFVLAIFLAHFTHAQDSAVTPYGARSLFFRRMLIGETCPDCKDMRCPGRVKKCSFGILRDSCNCCNICARGEGEVCGGKFYIHGKCAHNGHCDLRTATMNNPVGVCVNMASK